MVDFQNQSLQVHLLACEADGALFAISHVELPASVQSAHIMQAWQQATLAKMRSNGHTQLPLNKPGAASREQDKVQTLIHAEGLRDNGQPLQAQFLWRVSGAHIYHWAVYADKIQPHNIEPMFSNY